MNLRWKMSGQIWLGWLIIAFCVYPADSGKNDPRFVHPEAAGPTNVIGTIADDVSVITPLVQIKAEPNEDNDTYPIWYYTKECETLPNNNRPCPFWMDQRTGILYLQPNAGLNFDDVSQYRLRYCAVNDDDKDECSDKPNKNGPIKDDYIVINVLKVLYPPTWVNIPANISLFENIQFPQTIYSAEAYDPDVARRGETLTYSIISSLPAGAPYTIDANTGQITLNALLDYESQNFYTLNLRVTDGTTPVDSTFDIQVLDLNEKPTISGVPTFLIEDEDQIGVLSYQFTVGMTDPDADTLKVTMVCDPPTCPFTMDAGYNVYLNESAGILDYEQETTFTMTFTIDDGYLTDSAICTLYVRDINEPPWFTNVPTRLTVMEDEVVGHWLDQVYTMDVENDIITYYMTANPSDGAGFTIDADGIIRFGNAPGFDYETNLQYMLTVFATDGQTMIGPRQIVVDVLDVYEHPTIMNLPATVDLVEDMVQGSDLFQVKVTDPDLNDKLNYSILTSPLGGNGKFEIDQNGLISVVNNPNLDFETMPTYSMLVSVIDQGGLIDTEILTINVNNVPEPPVFNTADTALIVYEEMTVGDAVPVGILATDSDIGDIITYTLVATPNSGDFTLDTSGIAPVLRYATSLDYDTVTLPVFHNIKILATDLTGRTDTMSVDFTYLDINDNTPVFSAAVYTATIPENLSAGGYVLTISATDADIHYSKLYYTVDPSFPDHNYFNLDPITGELTVDVPPDFEQISYLTFDVLATDNGGLSTRATVQVTITDQNDNPPYWLKDFHNLEVWDSAQIGLVIAQVQAADIDTVTTTISFSMNDPSGIYDVDPSTGEISVRDPTDLEDGQSFTLEVTAIDTGGTPLRSTSPAIIRVDTYEQCSHHVTVSIQTAPSTFANASVRDSLESSLSHMFSKAQARIKMLNGQGVYSTSIPGTKTNMTLVFLKDGTALTQAMVGRVDKEFESVSDLMKVMEDSKSNLPNQPSALLKNAFGGYPVTGVFVSDPCPVPPPRFWTETPGGIALQSVLAALGLALTGLALVAITNRLLNQPLFGFQFSNCIRKAPQPSRPVADQTLDFRYNARDEAQLFRKTKGTPRPGSLVSLSSVHGGSADWKAKY